MTGKYDAIVVGAGIAGIVAALELAENGKKILLLDRDKKENLGGLAKESFGGMFFVDSPQQRKGKIKDSPELAWQDWCQFAEFDEADHWPRKWAQCYVENSVSDIYEPVTKRGVDFFPVVNWVERGQYQPGNSVPRFHLVWGSGHELSSVFAAHLCDHIKSKNVEIIFEKCVTAFDKTGGAVAGVQGHCEVTGDAFSYSAPIVIIASGGINGSDGMIRKHWPQRWGKTAPDIVLNGSHKFADGKIHKAANQVGGTVSHLDRMWNYAAGVHHPRPRKDRHGLSLVPSKSALWMDARGRRFGPEPLVSGFDTWELVRRVCAQEHKYSWAIMNKKIALKELAISGAEFNPSVRDKQKLKFILTVLFGNKPLLSDMLENCVDFVVANSVSELAEKMNKMGNPVQVDAAGMTRDIQAYDAQLERPVSLQNDDQLRRIQHLRQYRGDKLRTLKQQKIFDEKTLPLIAIRQFIISRKSLGGIQTDLQCRVLDGTGEPVSGLYAVGEAAGFGGGGAHGLRALEGTFLGGCILTARHAVRSIIRGE
jgi:predicted oxidoreductase